METSTIPLSELIFKAEILLRNLNYSSKTILRYKSAWNKFLSCCVVNGSTGYKNDNYPEVRSKIWRSVQAEDRTPGNVFRIRAFNILDEIHQHKEIRRCHQHTGVQVKSCFADLLGSYLDSKIEAGIVQRTAKNKSIQMTRFLNYLHANGFTNINHLNSELILSYAASLRDQYARNTVSGILFTLRDFLFFLYKKGLISTPFYQLFPVIYSNKRDKLPSYYYEDELKKMLTYVDRESVIGKRDYLVLVLAMQLGIRAGDIRMLQFSYFQWDKCTIEFVQHKTSNPISLPLPEHIKYAWIDYVKNSRPASNSPYIFIRNRAPYEPYASSNVFHYVITRYIKAAGIDCTGRRHGLHSMRHSLASNLLKNNTPYPVITGILGHENSSTTETYLSIDAKELRSVALEVPYER